MAQLCAQTAAHNFGQHSDYHQQNGEHNNTGGHLRHHHFQTDAGEKYGRNQRIGQSFKAGSNVGSALGIGNNQAGNESTGNIGNTEEFLCTVGNQQAEHKGQNDETAHILVIVVLQLAEEQEGQQEAISEEQNTEDNQEQNEQSEIIDNSQEDTYQTSEAETEDNQEAAVNANSQEMTEESGQETETVLEPDPVAENSWRYSNGSLISLPSTYTDYPYAWEKVDGKFVNSNGEVIPGAVKKRH